MGLRTASVASICLTIACCSGHPDAAPAFGPNTNVAAANDALVVPEPRFRGRPTMAEANEAFASAGVQPGQRLPQLSLVDLDGSPADLAALQRGRPLVLVTCSLTCNVARRQQGAVEDLRRKWADRAAVVMLYTIDAHPSGDACPYTGDEWVPPANEADRVLIRQPTSLRERLAAAKRYAERWALETPILVDTMDNAAWTALGGTPNAGLCIGADGIVCARTGWFDAAQIDAALAKSLGT
jgi:hypothetical protein